MIAFTSKARSGTETAPSAMPNASASPAGSRPVGRGRLRVRTMKPSLTRSRYMLSVFAAPTTRAVPITAAARRAPSAIVRGNAGGFGGVSAPPNVTSRRDAWWASQMPPSIVTTTMSVMRGLVSVTRSARRPGLTGGLAGWAGGCPPIVPDGSTATIGS